MFSFYTTISINFNLSLDMPNLLKLLSQKQLIDLSHPLTTHVPTWSGGCGFQHHLNHDYSDFGFRSQSLNLLAQAGTHMDAPSHFKENYPNTDGYPLSSSFVTAASIVIFRKFSEHITYQIPLDDMRAFEDKNGRLVGVQMVIFKTGFSKFWNNPDQYRSKKNDHLHLPEILPEVAHYLLEKNIESISVDMLSPDGGNLDFPIHHLWLGEKKFIFENLNLNYKNLSPFLTVGVFPLLMEGTTEAPTRMIGFQ